MLVSRICAFIFFFLKYNFSASMAEKPMCSRFSCEEQLLEKMIRQEIKVEMMQNDIKKTQEIVFNTLEEIRKSGVEVAQALEATLESNFTEFVKRTKDTLRKTFEELRENFSNEIDVQRRSLTRFVEDMKKPSVAFFAHNVEDLKLDKTDKIIVFTTTTTNEGSGYDTSTGIFTAPVGGLYQFSVSFCSPTNKYSPLALVISGNVVARSTNYDKDYPTCSSFSTVKRVEVGEKIWVKCFSGSSDFALQSSTLFMNSFSGILINN